MWQLLRQRSAKTGLPPGTPVYVGPPTPIPTKITTVVFAPDHCETRDLTPADPIAVPTDGAQTTWINVDGLQDVAWLTRLGDAFALHPLVIEDVCNQLQRPKLVPYDDYLFLVVRAAYYEPAADEITTEQISLVIGRGFLLSFQQNERNLFTPILDQLRAGKGRLRQLGSDYLAYSLLDFVVDNYFVVLERLGERIELLEDALIEHASPEMLQTIHRLKREMIHLRHAVWPLREVVLGLEREESQLLDPAIRPYLRDLYDHTVQVMELVESLRDVLGEMIDVYLSSVNNRLNAVMKVLTIIATIFMPITFVTGVFGMNFVHIPGLHSEAVFWGVIGGMAAVAAAMLALFRRQRWI